MTLMNNTVGLNRYKYALDHVEFDTLFEERTVTHLSQESRRREHKLLAYCASIICAAAVTVVILLNLKAPELSENSVVLYSPASSASEVSSRTQSTSASTRIIVMSSDYGSSDLDSYLAPKPGQMVTAEGVKRSLKDIKNTGSYFFVHIDVIPPERYSNKTDNYIYNGHSIKEWRELSDLSKGEYPYGEYKGDHGGNVTKAEWEAAQKEAKTLDATKNCKDALEKYNKEVIPMLNTAKSSREKTELERLKKAGYDVFFMNTWEYKSDSEKKYTSILAGLLSSDQINDFSADTQCGYFIDWVYNGDGIIDWNEALRS
jgi:hypothetical protein